MTFLSPIHLLPWRNTPQETERANIRRASGSRKSLLNLDWQVSCTLGFGIITKFFYRHSASWNGHLLLDKIFDRCNDPLSLASNSLQHIIQLKLSLFIALCVLAIMHSYFLPFFIFLFSSSASSFHFLRAWLLYNSIGFLFFFFFKLLDWTDLTSRIGLFG